MIQTTEAKREYLEGERGVGLTQPAGYTCSAFFCGSRNALVELACLWMSHQNVGNFRCTNPDMVLSEKQKHQLYELCHRCLIIHKIHSCLISLRIVQISHLEAELVLTNHKCQTNFVPSWRIQQKINIQHNIWRT